MGEPALAHEKTDELLGSFNVAAIFECHGRIERAEDRKSLAVRAERPFDRGGVLVVVLRTLALERVGNRERVVQHDDDRPRQERLVVVAVGVPVDRAGWGAALPIEGGVGVHRLDEPAPHLRIVDHEPAVPGHVVRIVGSHELEELNLRVGRFGRHVEADAPYVVPPRRPAHGRLHLVAPERPESVPLFGDVLEREPCLLEEALPDVDVVGRAAHRQRVQRPLPGLPVEQRQPGERVRIEQVREVADGVGEVHEPIVKCPSA